MRPPTAPCRVLIADDHPVVRSALRRLLESAPQITVVAEAQDGAEALAKITDLRPTVAVVDIRMPKLDGIEVARRVATARTPTRVVLLTVFDDERAATASLAAGAAGFIPKATVATHLITAIETVTSSGSYVHPTALPAPAGHSSVPAIDGHADLNPSEQAVLRRLALGFAQKEIAAELSLGENIVENHRVRVMEKVGASSRVDLVRFALKRGWLGNAPLF